jgi:hypothetical protein
MPRPMTRDPCSTISESLLALVSPRITLSLTHEAEITWYPLQTIADVMLVRRRLPPKLTYHSIQYAIEVFSVLPVKKLLNKAGECTAPFETLMTRDPYSTISDSLIAFVSPRSALSLTHEVMLHKHSQTKGCQRYLHWTPPNWQGWLVFLQQSNRLTVSNDCYLDETVSDAMYRAWIPFSDALALRPIKSLLPKPNSVHGHTVDATTLLGHSIQPTQPKDGNGDPSHTQNTDET